MEKFPKSASGEILEGSVLWGTYWVGCNSKIAGQIITDTPFQIEDAETWIGLKEKHRVDSDALPYKHGTFAMPILKVKRVDFPYKHTLGAINIVRYSE